MSGKMDVKTSIISQEVDVKCSDMTPKNSCKKGGKEKQHFLFRFGQLSKLDPEVIKLFPCSTQLST